MGPTTFRDQGFQFGIHDPGALPAVAHVFKGRGVARVQILPEVALLDTRDLADGDRDAALGLVIEHRDRLLGLWAAALPRSTAAPGPLATAARFDASNRILAVELKGGAVLRVPAVGMAALAGAADDQVAEVEAIAGGDALYWPGLDRHLRVRDLVAAAGGLAPWPQEVEGPVREGPVAPDAPPPPPRMKMVPDGDGWKQVPIDPVPEPVWTPKAPPATFKPGQAMPKVNPSPPKAPPPPPPAAPAPGPVIAPPPPPAPAAAPAPVAAPPAAPMPAPPQAPAPAQAPAVAPRPAPMPAAPAAVATAATATATQTRPSPPPPGPGKIKSLLGLILYREGFLTQPQVNQVFQEQMRLKQQEGKEVGFGQVAVDLGMIDQRRVQFGLHLQGSLAHGADGAKPLGVYLLESTVVRPSQLLQALEEQKRSGAKLGEILVGQGLVTAEVVETFLQRQAEMRKPPAAAPAEPPPTTPGIKKAPPGAGVKSLLSMILEREDYLSQSQVQTVLLEQDQRKRNGKVQSFGEVALEMGLLNAEQLRFAMNLQAKLAYSADKPKPLGFFLVENGVVKPSQLQIALDEATRQNKRLGEVLIEQGVISESLVTVFLNMQKAQGV